MGFLFAKKRVHLAALTIAVAAVSSLLLSAFTFGNKAFSMEILPEPFYKYRSDGQAGRAIKISLKELDHSGPINIKTVCNGISETTTVDMDGTSGDFLVMLPAGVSVTKGVNVDVTVSAGNTHMPATVYVPAKKQWTVYIYPHSHLDIGYTGLPESVEKIQTRNIDVGIDIAKKTQSYPKGSRFVWNPEATWVVKKYLQRATPQQKASFVEAVKKGWVQLDGGHSNLNTSTCSDEELLHFFNNVPQIENVTGQPISTMVQMDVPGAAWGLVSVAAQYGVKGMINFPNNYDVRKDWEHKPFYWLAPDGKTKMLFLQGFPYGIGYTIKGHKYGLGKLQTYSTEYDRVSTNHPSEDFLDPFIFEETQSLEDKNSPYDIFAMTWSMADNCVIDADLPEAVKAWNSKYAYPKLVISGSKEILDAYKQKYDSIIPTYSGDFTEFWTNGLGSDAASVGEGRIAKENLVQAETLWSLLQPGKAPAKDFDSAWQNVLLSAEHTWGAQDPRSELAKKIEAQKAGYFRNAEAQSKHLIRQAIAPFVDANANGFSVVNTLSWARGGIITLSADESKNSNGVVDDHNKPVPSQRLSTGELIFQAKDIPPFSSRYYKLVNEAYQGDGQLKVTNSSLENGLLSVKIDSKTGAISSAKNIASGFEYVDEQKELDAYEYLPGVYNGRGEPGQPSGATNVTMKVKEQGPLMVSVMVNSDGQSINGLAREIKLYADQPVVEITNTIDKISTYKKEGIHFEFGFDLPNSVNRMDMPWSIVQPEKDQLPSANKNWFAFQRWADVSAQNHGVTWTSVEAPLIEWGALSGNILDGARLYRRWNKSVPQTSTLYSWALNNHWNTNFPLRQGGMIAIQYALQFHKVYNVVAANRFGTEQRRPLLVIKTRKNLLDRPALQLDNPMLMVSTLKQGRDQKMLVLHIRSLSGKVEKLSLSWPGKRPKQVIACSMDGKPLPKQTLVQQVEPYGMACLQLLF